MGNKLRFKKKWIEILSIFFSYAITFWLLLSMIFILLRLSPGDPALKYLSPQLSTHLYDDVKISYGLDKPVFEQYYLFIYNLFRGDFGISYNYRVPVSSMLMETAPFTISFSLVSFLLQVAISMWVIFYIHKHKGNWFEKSLNKISLFLYSLPTMTVGLALIFIFSIQLGLFPLSDVHSTNFDELNIFQKLLDLVKHLTLPLITLSLPGIIIFYNYLHGNIEATEKKSFIRFMIANGFDKNIVFKKHVIPNSINPLISILGTELGILLGGAVITETLFGLPGLGRLTVSAILTRDYPLIIGCVFFSGVFVLAANFLADLYKLKHDVQLRENFKNL